MRCSRLPVLPVLACFLLGCGDQPRSDGGQDSRPTPAAFAGRLEAAKAIQSVNERDAALADLAKDSAEAGDGSVTGGALDAIQTSEVHDNAAAEAAVLLAKAGKVDDAVAVAKLIRQSSLRDRTLARIAKDE